MSDFLNKALTDQTDALLKRKSQLLDSLAFESGGLQWCQEQTAIVDQAIQAILARVYEVLPDAPRLAVAAVGGYGRKELAPYSDIDLTVTPQEDDSRHLDEALRLFFRTLHEILGTQFHFELGYAYRLAADIPGLDPTSRTSLIDARLVAGSSTVFNRLMETFWANLPPGEFIVAKITERELAMAKSNDSPLVVEPNLKEGSGGLRSFQCANWLRTAIGERPKRGGQHYDSLLRARNLLHFVSGRKQDLLTRQRVTEISEQWGINRGDFLQEILHSLISGSEEFLSVKESLRETRFRLSMGVDAIRGEARIRANASPGEAAVGLALASKLGIAVSDFPVTFSNTFDGAAILFGLSQGEPTLRDFDRCGLLDAILPELTACRTLLPGDSSHVYTVFEHTLRVIRSLDESASNPFLARILESLPSKSILYLAALIHDVGKINSGSTGKSHCETGVDLASQICARLKLDASVTNTVQWLVKEHQTMSLFTRLRDLENPATIIEFSKIVQSPDRLHMLALLTWADIDAVGPGILTTGQEALIKEIVQKTYDALEGDLVPEVSPPHTKRVSTIKRLAKDLAQPSEIEAFLLDLPAQYLSGTASKDVQSHYKMVQLTRQGEANFNSNNLVGFGATEVTVAALDHPGLLSELLGIFYALELNVSSIRAFTTTSDPKVAVDIFRVSFGNKPIPLGTTKILASTLGQVLGKTLKVDDLLRAKEKDPHRRQQVFQYKFLPGSPAILEVQSPRGKGMPFRLSRFLSDQGLNILSARVGQWAGAAAAAFYIESSTDEHSTESLVQKAIANLASNLSD